MIIRAYSIQDAKAQTFMLPFFQHTDAIAERSFRANALSDGSMMNKFPADFFLYHVGEYDDTTGHYTSCTPRLVISGGDLG